MPRLIFVFVLKLALLCGLSAYAQDANPVAPDRSATGGAQTLEDILARQRGEALDDSFRRDREP